MGCDGQCCGVFCMMVEKSNQTRFFIHVLSSEFPKVLTVQYKIMFWPAGQSGVHTVYSTSPDKPMLLATALNEIITNDAV